MKLYCITLILFDVVVAFSARGIFSGRRMDSSLLMASDGTNEQEPRTNLQTRVNKLADRRAKIQLEINVEEEKAKELRIKFEKLKKEIELEGKKKAEEEVAKAAAEAKKKIEEEALVKKKAEEEALMKKKAEEEALKKKIEEEALMKKAEEEAAAKKKVEEETLMKKKAEEEATAKKKAEEASMKKKTEEEEVLAKKKVDEEALMKKKAEEEATAKKKAEEETLIRTMKEIAKTNGDTSKTVAPSVPAVIPNELNQQLNLPKAFNIDTLKKLSSSNQVRVVTGLATSFSALVLLRSFLMERTETLDENSKSAIVQAMERAGLGERPQKRSKPYTKVQTTQKIDITAADQMASKPKAGAGNTKAKSPTKAKPPTKPKPKPRTTDEAPEKAKQESVSNVDISPQPESKRVPSQNSDTKTTESTPAEKQVDTTQGLGVEKETKTSSDKIAESKPAPQTKDQLSPSSNSINKSSDKDNRQISPNTSPSKPSRPFLGGSSSYLDSL